MPIVDLLLFVASAAMAWFGRWQAGDLVWGLWLSSLVVATACCSLGSSPRSCEATLRDGVWGRTGRPIERSVPRPPPRVPAGGGLCACSSCPSPSSSSLSFFFPPGNHPPTGDLRVLAQDLRQVVITRWPFLVLSIISARDAFAQAAAAFTPMTSYRNVLRMHLLIFFFAFAKIVHLDGRLVYLAVLFVYFYPWEAMRRVAGLGPRT
jgi:hypothetical protein